MVYTEICKDNTALLVFHNPSSACFWTGGTVLFGNLIKCFFAQHFMQYVVFTWISSVLYKQH